jgi:hypothetical protein
MRKEVRERERPEPSVVWQTLGITFTSFAFALGLSAVTLAEHLAADAIDLWIAAAGFVLAAGLCFAAHRDVNRGRRSKLREVEEVGVGSAEDWSNPRAG